MTKYEANHKHSGNMNCFHLGFITQFLRYFLIFYMSQYILDHYQLNNYVEEYWIPSRYSYPTGICFNVSEPYTLSFHKGLVSYTQDGDPATAVLNPDAQTPIRYS